MIPESSNFFASLSTTRSRRSVAGLFTPPTWVVRKCGWADYEVNGSFADFVIEAESPTLLHGSVADVVAKADQILATLRAAGIGYTAECYAPDGELLREWVWQAT